MSTAVEDTFTAADGTDIDSHTGEIGATWTRDAVFGQGTASGPTFGIFNNKLRRYTAAEQPGADGSSALVRPSGVLPPGTTHIRITITYTFTTGGGNAQLWLYEQAVNPGNDKQIWQSEFGASVGYTRTAVIDIEGTVVSDEGGYSAVRPAMPQEPFGFALWDNDGAGGDIAIDYIKIESAPPSGAFWTNYAYTTETIA